MRGLLLTIGTSHESEIFSIREIGPTYVAFLCTDTIAADEAINVIINATSLPPGFTERFRFADSPPAIDEVIERSYEAYRWLRGRIGDDGEIIANFTAGRKWMSAGLLFVLSRLPVEVVYVDVSYEGGKVVPGTERLVQLGNAYAKNWMFEIERGARLFNSYRFGAARDVFNQVRQAARLPNPREFATALSCISEQIDKWDRFHHDGVDTDRLANDSERLEQVATHLGLTQFCDFARAIQRLSQNIDFQRNDAADVWKMGDLFWNAKRRFETGNFEDAVARCYRLTEALLDFYLRRYGVDNTGDIHGLRMKLEELCQRSEKDALRFVKDKENLNSWKMPITDRNKSILAHGWQPVGGRVAKTYLEWLESELNNVIPNLSSLYQLPRMPEVWQ
jgi:CRISPR-associated protein (TIGR02710 family)